MKDSAKTRALTALSLALPTSAKKVGVGRHVGSIVGSILPPAHTLHTGSTTSLQAAQVGRHAGARGGRHTRLSSTAHLASQARSNLGEQEAVSQRRGLRGGGGRMWTWLAAERSSVQPLRHHQARLQAVSGRA